jgi:UDPglucose 6-dehydrogenase
VREDIIIMNILVIGAGYVGLVQGACLAELGHNVGLVDINKERVAALKKGQVPFFEPGLEELVVGAQESNRLEVFVSQQDAVKEFSIDVIFICVQTPRLEDGSCNLSAIEFVCKELKERVSSGLVVIKSTIPPGTRASIEGWLGESLRLGSNPEFLREGSAVNDFFHPDRIVIGVDSQDDEQLLKDVYKKIDAPVFAMSVESAQLTKYAANTMLAMRLSLINEFAVIADCVGADIKDVESAIGSDPRIGSKFLRAGAGFGGSCFPKDVLALADTARRCGFESLLIDPIIEVNNRQSKLFVDKIEHELQGVKGKGLAVWGLAFNKNTDDTRESPAMKIVIDLINRGANLSVYDPQAMKHAKFELGDKVSYADSMMDTLSDADALCVLTEWDDFLSVDWQAVGEALSSKKIFDGKNFLPREKLKQEGLEVYGMGLCNERQVRLPKF